MAAVLYDESLDQFKPHSWMQGLNVFRQDYAPLSQRFENQAKGMSRLQGQWAPRKFKNTQLSYRSFPREITANLYGYRYFVAVHPVAQYQRWQWKRRKAGLQQPPQWPWQNAPHPRRSMQQTIWQLMQQRLREAEQRNRMTRPQAILKPDQTCHR